MRKILTLNSLKIGKESRSVGPIATKEWAQWTMRQEGRQFLIPEGLGNRVNNNRPQLRTSSEDKGLHQIKIRYKKKDNNKGF
jgi:hypothetical protein